MKGRRIRKITQITFANPETSPRRNRSLNTVISSQIQMMNIKMMKTSNRKVPRLRLPRCMVCSPNLSGEASAWQRRPDFGQGIVATQTGTPEGLPNVRFGSFSTDSGLLRDVRYAPESDQNGDVD